MDHTVAHVGAFSMSNWGDKLYPKVIEEMLRERGFDAEINYFALLAGQSEEGQRIHPLRKLRSMSPKAVIVGGGDLIRADIRTVAMDHLSVPWSSRSKLINRARARFLEGRAWPPGPGPWLPAEGWGSPTALVSVGVHPLPDSEETSRALGHVTSAWVRTHAGAQVLESHGFSDERLSVAPDAVFAMRAFDDPGRLRERGRALLKNRWGLSEPPVLFHAAPFHGWDEARISSVIQRLVDYSVATLELGRYCGEQVELTAAAKASRIPALKGLSADETTEVIAAAGAIFTTSMHAAIVASCVGTPVLVPKVGKTMNAFAACPTPPQLAIVDDLDLENALGDLYGERLPLSSQENAVAARTAFAETIKRINL